MIDITLEGILAEKFGKEWNLDVRSIIEIFEAIEANTGKFSKFSRDLQKTFNHFVVYINNKLVPAHYLCAKILKSGDKVKILPVIKGSVALFWIGLALMILSIVISIVFSPKAPKDVKTASSSISGIKNVLNRNIAVPIGYGRFKIGSAVVSNELNSISLTLNNNNTYNGGAGAGGAIRQTNLN